MKKQATSHAWEKLQVKDLSRSWIRITLWTNCI